MTAPQSRDAEEGLLAQELGIAPEVWSRLGWRRITGASFKLGELRKLGFTKDAEFDASGGAFLLPIWWWQGDQVQIVNHRLRYDRHKKRPGKYDHPRGRGQVHGAFGLLLESAPAWRSSEIPLVVTEGDKKAAVLVSYLPELCVVSSPGVWNQNEPRSEQEKTSGYPRRPHEDLKALELRKRRVIFIGDRDAIDGTKPAVRQGTDETCRALAQRGAQVFEVYPPQGPYKGLDDWINFRREQLHPDESVAVLRAELEQLIAQAKPWLPPEGEPVSAAPAHEQGARLHDVLPAHLRAGPSELVMPERFAILDARGAPLAVVKPGGVTKKLASSVFWPVAEIEIPGGHLLEVAAIVRGRLRYLQVPRALLHDRRRLCGLLASHGINLRPDAEEGVPDFISSFLEANEATLPLRRAQPTTGWDDTTSTFLYGTECIGGSAILLAVDEDQAARGFLDALGKKGVAATWKQAAEEMMRSAPVAALVLAAAVASPMLRPFGWAPMGILLGALGGAGKSSLLRLGASVYGSSGPAELDQPGGLVGKADGTTRGLLLQFRRLGHLPHLADELKPSLVDPRKREELASTLHDVFEGREHIRATRTSEGTKVGWAFPGCAVLAGEVSASDFLRKGGVVRRYLTPPAPYTVDGAHLGRFRDVLATNYGHLGRALCEALVATSAHGRWQIRDRHRHHLEMLAVKQDAPEHLRSWARQIGTALGAVDVCAELVPELCPDPELWKESILTVWRSLWDAEMGEESDVASAAWERTRSWLAENRTRVRASRALEHRLSGTPDEVRLRWREPVIGQIVSAHDEGKPDERLEKVDVVQRLLSEFLMGEGYSLRTLTGTWLARGWVETTDGQRTQGEVARSVWLCGTKVKVYRLVLAPGLTDG